MYDLKNELLDIFYMANEQFLRKNMNNIESNVSERNLCSLLSLELNRAIEETKYKEYFCDVEYNRNCGKVKSIINENCDIIDITCDLILHSRGTKVKDNLIAIEMKKSTAPNNEMNDDRARLRCLTKQSYEGVYSFDGREYPKNVCLYEIGIFYILDIKKRKITLEIYSDSKFVNSETNTFEYFMSYKKE